MLNNFLPPRNSTRPSFASSGRKVLVGAIVISALVLGGCATDRTAADPAQGRGKAAEKPVELPPKFSVKDGATDVDPFEPVTVTSQGQGLESVTMTNEVGYVVEEKLSEDGKVWTNDEVLGFNRTYTIEAEDVNGARETIKFSTPQATGLTAAALSPLPDSTVGVGQTIGVRFSVPIADRKAAEKLIDIKTSPQTEGAFYWLNDFELRWRPKEFWQPGTEVNVKVALAGAELGDGVYGTEDNATNFTIGDRVVATVDDATKMMQVYRNGELLREIPVSLGKDVEFATPNGTYVIGDKHEKLLMDSTTYGLSLEDGGYKTMVDYATQMSYSGIYVHGAPWSEWAQGNTNTSHGCVNVTNEAAGWFQSVVKRGDIVQVKNTAGGTLPVTDGLGDWNLPWPEWSSGNS